MDFVGLGLLVVVALLFAWLATRAWRIKNGALRWLAVIPAGLVTLAALGLTGAALNGYAKFNAVQPNPVRQLTIAGTPAQIERGHEIARTCSGCHSSTGNLPLLGQNFAEGGPPLGTLWAPALTAAHFREWSDGEIIRAIREGVHRSGRSLLIMPSSALHSMSDEDVQSLVAFIRQHEPNAADTPPAQLNLVGALLMNVANFQTVQPPLAGAVSAPPRGPTAAYGDYMLGIGGCRDCHGGNLAGVPPGTEGVPAGPNLTNVGQMYSEEQLIRLLREGIKPDNTHVGEEMPYKEFELYSDDDFRAIFAYLQALEPLPNN